MKGKSILIAYEPVWAISTSGSSRKITLNEIYESMKILKEMVNKSFPELKKAKLVKCIYGGSVNSKNIKNIFYSHFIEGILVGGESLSLTKFKNIISSS